jgi:hypothetical protein
MRADFAAWWHQPNAGASYPSRFEGDFHHDQGSPHTFGGSRCLLVCWCFLQRCICSVQPNAAATVRLHERCYGTVQPCHPKYGPNLCLPYREQGSAQPILPSAVREGREEREQISLPARLTNQRRFPGRRYNGPAMACTGIFGLISHPMMQTPVPQKKPES